MPAVWDIFGTDAYSVRECREAVNRLPYNALSLGELSIRFGLFRGVGIPTTSFFLESKDSKISLIPNTPRNTPGAVRPPEKRKARAFACLHLPLEDAIWPDDVQDVRRFDSANELETVESVVGERLDDMRDDFEVNHEYHRVNAVQGLVKDHDGTTILNLFTEFGLTELNVNFNWATATDTTVQSDAMAVVREIEDVIGNKPYTGIIGLCSDAFWDAMVASGPVADHFNRWENGRFERDDLRSVGFQYKGITWVNYRGSVGSHDFIDNTSGGNARFFPVGVRGLFRAHFAPANWVDAANTIGLPMYVGQEPKPKKAGVDIFGETNPFFYCTQPGACVRGSNT